MKPSTSLSAQASVFSIGSPCMMPHDHLGLDRLGVDLVGDLRRRRRRRDRQDLVVVRVRVVVERALRRPFLGPGLERRSGSRTTAGRSRRSPPPSSRPPRGCDRCTSRLLAAGLFLPKFQMPQKYGRNGAKRPFGPAGKPWVQHCSATCGASRLATAQALGGFMISAPLPETSHLLLEASSQAGASGGRELRELACSTRAPAAPRRS